MKKLIEQLEVIKAAIEWELPIDHQITIDNAIEKINLCDFILHWLADCFDAPCQYSFNGEEVSDFMGENVEGYCEEKCSDVTPYQCWETYLTAYKKYIDDRNKGVIHGIQNS